jgi:magnesium chelatase family protein
MPRLTADEAVEVTKLHSLAGSLNEEIHSLITRPPFRSPHHSASAEGILGGGRTVRPGEITLAHYGILFLDEAPEFRSNVLQALREPLEDRVITIARAEGQVQLPADFQLILAANACPCGKLGSKTNEAWEQFDTDHISSGGMCFCSPEEIHRYWRKFSGALLDRVELRVAVVQPDCIGDETEFTGHPVKRESSRDIAGRVEKAVAIQRRRFEDSRRSENGQSGSAGAQQDCVCRRNAHMSPAMIDAFCQLTQEAAQKFRKVTEHLALSGRGCHGILRTARTIADLEGAERIVTDHILEAAGFRRLGDDPYDVSW